MSQQAPIASGVVLIGRLRSPSLEVAALACAPLASVLTGGSAVWPRVHPSEAIATKSFIAQPKRLALKMLADISARQLQWLSQIHVRLC